MNQSVRCQRFAAVQLKWAAMKITYAPACFLNDQGACRCIPGIQIEFPEPFEAPACDRAQIERRRSCPPDPMSMQRDLVIEINIRVLVALVTGEAGRDQRFS